MTPLTMPEALSVMLLVVEELLLIATESGFIYLIALAFIYGVISAVMGLFD